MSENHDEVEEKGFSVADKRRFAADGSARPGEEEDAQSSADESQEPPSPADHRALPEIDFSTFILSLSTSALVHLGQTPMPDGMTKKDLQLAKQTIDILGLLKAKTQGNLTEEESQLLSSLLYDLRIQFVSATK